VAYAFVWIGFARARAYSLGLGTLAERGVLCFFYTNITLTIELLCVHDRFCMFCLIWSGTSS